MSIETGEIAEVLNKYDLVYSSSTTSAAVDAYCVGLPVISHLDGNDLNMSPLRGFDSVFFVSTSEELAEVINCIDRIDGCSFIEKEFFNLGLELFGWKSLLGLKG